MSPSCRASAAVGRGRPPPADAGGASAGGGRCVSATSSQVRPFLDLQGVEDRVVVAAAVAELHRQRATRVLDDQLVLVGVEPADIGGRVLLDHLVGAVDEDVEDARALTGS